MQYFSEEYRDKLVNEHKLVSTAIVRITDGYKQYAPHHTGDAIAAAHTSLRARKVELEVMIDVLNDHLHG